MLFRSNWPYPEFVIPEAIKQAWNYTKKGFAAESAWKEKLVAYEEEYPELAMELVRRIKGQLPGHFLKKADQFVKECQQNNNTMATRKASQNCLEAYAPLLPEVIGGSADLAGSNLTLWSGSTPISEKADGNYIYYGVREFGMTAISSGIALHGGFIPYSATFLIFMEYARNAARMAALMKQRSILVYTHDSIGQGEDGPTHQPVEHLMSLRLIPNIELIRPANNIEIQHSYKYLFSENNKTKVLVLTRQDLPYFDNSLSYEEFLQGAYEISSGSDLTLIATGSEVHLALKIKDLLKDKSVQIISAPILNKFLSENIENFKMNNLVFSIELGRSIGWKDYVGNVTKSFSIETFGKSANEKDLEKHFKFEAEKIKLEILSYFD